LKFKILIVIILVLVIFGFLNYYIGLRGWSETQRFLKR
jgi:hypothetical protein